MPESDKNINIFECVDRGLHEVQDEESVEGGKCWRQESKEKGEGEGEESKVNSYYTNLWKHLMQMTKENRKQEMKQGRTNWWYCERSFIYQQKQQPKQKTNDLIKRENLLIWLAIFIFISVGWIELNKTKEEEREGRDGQ